MYKTRFITNY